MAYTAHYSRWQRTTGRFLAIAAALCVCGSPRVDAQSVFLVPPAEATIPEKSESPTKTEAEVRLSGFAKPAPMRLPQVASPPVMVEAIVADRRMDGEKQGDARGPTVVESPQLKEKDEPKASTEEKPVGEIRVTLTPPSGSLPPNVAQDRYLEQLDPWDRRAWGDLTYAWHAPITSHRPLYYEDINLERHGYARHPCLRPITSGAHFFASTLALPYSMAIHPPNERIYPLGHYRPGNRVPAHIHWPEWNPKAAAIQSGAIAGGILLVP